MERMKIGSKNNGSQYEGQDFSVNMEINQIEPSPSEQPETTVQVTEQVPETNTEVKVDTVQEGEQAAPLESADPNINTPSEVVSATTDEAQKEVQVTPQEVVYDDSSVLQYLNEKLGKEYSSFDDLNKQPEEPQQVLPEDVQQILEWKERTGRPLNEWVEFQKDYDNMPDEQVAREILKLRYPGLDVEDELKAEYLPTEDDLDTDISRKNRNLKKLAIDGRKELNNLRMQFNTPSEGYQKLTPEIQSELDFARQVRDNIKNQEATQQQYNEQIKNAALELSSIPLDLGEGSTINFNIEDSFKKSLPDMVNKMPHWYNSDGTLNHSAVVKDVAVVSQLDKIVQLAYKQGKDAGIDAQTKKENNITLDTKSMDSTTKSAPKFIVEGQDHFFKKSNVKIKRR